MELLKGNRIALIRKCKLEEIHLAIVGDATLHDLPLEELDVSFL
jgi:hypothetical protein